MPHFSKVTITTLMLTTTTIALYLCIAFLNNFPMWLDFLAPGLLMIGSAWFCKKMLA